MPTIAWTHGELPDAILAAARASLGDDARTFADSFASKASDAGFSVIREVMVASRGDGRRGRIDFVVRDGDRSYAIECDRKTPRQKSKHKLMQYACHGRMIVCRE